MKRALLIAAVALAAAGCGSSTAEPVDPPPPSTTTTTTIPRDALDTARAQWEATKPASYTFDFDESCFCANRHLRITVVDGKATAKWVPGADQLDDSGGSYDPLADPPTIESLFDQIAEVRDGDQGTVKAAKYNAETGVPEQVSLDTITNAIDDEYGWTIENFTVN